MPSSDRGYAIMVKLSIVVPLFCEEEAIPNLVLHLMAAVRPLGLPFEVLLVDDGSHDGTAAAITTAAAAYAEISGIFLARNYGQTAALQAGFDRASGEIVVTLDGDLQNDPTDIPRLLEILEKGGADVVAGWRKNRKDAPLRMWLSRRANALIARIVNLPLHDFGCTLRAYRSDMLKQIRIYGEMHRFLPAVLADVGARVVEIEVAHHPRRLGQSKYGLNRTFRVLLDLVLLRFLHRYVHRPMHFFGGIGLVLIIPGLAISIWLAFIRLVLGEPIGGRPLLLLGAFLLLTGIVMIAQGVIAEIISRLLFEATDRKQYRLRRPRSSVS